MTAQTTSDAVLLERQLCHAPERVFAAFTSAKAVAAWLSPAPEIAPDVRQWDFRREGEYIIAYPLPGAASLVLFGTFLRIEPPAFLSMTWQWREPDPHAGVLSHVAITIARTDTGSALQINHTRLESAGMPERHGDGWVGALQRLDQFLTTSQQD